jgi:multidrug transporter EmrE-like cation transporter
MSFTTFTLVIAAACLHAFWNLTAKRVSGNLGVLWLGLWMGGIVLAPFALFSVLRSFDLVAIPYLLASALVHTAYFALLAAGYRHGELSTVYPLARGTGVAGTAVVAWTVIEEHISVVGALGIVVVCLGIVLLGLRERHHPARTRSWLMALLVGFTITGYSVVDKLGVGLVSPVVYSAGLVTGTAIFLAPVILLKYREECRLAWRDRKGASLWVGLGSMAAYLLILVAFRQANASYIVAARELSIARGRGSRCGGVEGAADAGQSIVRCRHHYRRTPREAGLNKERCLRSLSWQQVR